MREPLQESPRAAIPEDSTYDVAIIGSGFAGSILARALNRRGQRVLLLERDQHPRFAIGESTTPLANFALERLAARYDLPDLHHLSSHGRWLEHLPHLRRGLKRGFTFFQHRRDKPYRNASNNPARLMVAASPDDWIADTHWLRQDVDHHLVERAVEEGVDYRDETLAENVEITDEGVRLEARRQGERLRFEASFVVDGSGLGGFLAHSLPLAPPSRPIAFDSSLLYAHFDGVRGFADVARLEPGPYPDERAAVHHLLDFGWMYMLPFDHGTVSAGLILRRDAERPPEELLTRHPAEAWRRLIARYPSLAEQLAGATASRPIRYIPRMQHRLGAAAGPRWFLLPHAYAFYDPLFSAGMAWSLLAVERLAALLSEGSGDWRSYAELLAAEADQIERLIETAYLAQHDFELFVSVTFLYFATVSFAEASQRLLDPAPGALSHTGCHAGAPFLGAGDPEHEALFMQARNRVHQIVTGSGLPPAASCDFRSWILEQIAPFNIAGFDRGAVANSYPVDLDLLVDRASLLGLTRDTLRSRLPRLRGRDTPRLTI